MMVRLPKMTKYEIEDLIKEHFLCRIAFKGEDYPYIAPFQYVYMNGALYFHFTDYGRKMRLLEKDSRVCVEIEKYQPDLSEYSFISVRGRLEKVTDPHERTEAIERLSKYGQQRISTNFLAAHGLRKEEGWSSLSPERLLVIVKLAKIAEEIGIKSPSD